MATKMKVPKMLQEIKGYAQITNRRPAPRPPLLYLMQLRTHPVSANLPKHRLAIATDPKAFATGPASIKISHVKSNEPGQPVVIC